MSRDKSKYFQKKKSKPVNLSPGPSQFQVKPVNQPEVIDYYRTSPDGVNWTKRPGNILITMHGVKPEDTDPSIHGIIDPFIEKAINGDNKEYPQKLRDCIHKLHGVRYHLKTIQQEVSDRVEEFRKEYTAGSGITTEIENPRLTYETEAFLFQVKSSLDLLIQALGTRVPPLKTMTTFKHKNVDGKNHAGGTVIIALSTNGFPELARIFEENRIHWIQHLVEMRDTVTHYSQLKGFHCFLEGPYKGPDGVTIHYPSMPNGDRVDQYCEDVFSLLLALYNEILNNLPEIVTN
jgi:hypothetical protein